MNLNNLLDAKELVAQRNKIKKIFFYRICGTGMGAAACLLRELGYEVAGCDVSFSPPMSTYLDESGIKCFPLKDFDPAVLKQYDLIVVGNSVPRVSDHATLIEECGVPFTSFPSAIGTLVLKDKEVIGVAGTHGKTTTTFFMTQMLERLGEDAGYFIGGIIDGRAPSKVGKSKYLVIESDEYDSAYFQKFAKFQLYELDHMILTSLEFDHADIYSNVEEIEQQFAQVLPKMPNGHVVANSTYPSIQKLASTIKHNWTFYGENSDNGPQLVKMDHKGAEFKIRLNGNWHSVVTNVIGHHNILNIASCMQMLVKLGFSSESVTEAVRELSMVKRRQEVRGSYNGAIVIDDFAHHPRAITLTIEAIRTMFPDKELLTVFEPISATSRSDIFQKEFAQSLQISDRVILARNPLSTSVKGHQNLNCQQLVDDINSNNTPAVLVDNLTDLQKSIDQWAKDEQVLLILSNRTCLGLWESDFVKKLA